MITKVTFAHSIWLFSNTVEYLVATDNPEIAERTARMKLKEDGLNKNYKVAAMASFEVLTPYTGMNKT